MENSLPPFLVFKRVFFVARIFCLLGFLAVPPARAYFLEGPKWPNGSVVTFQLGLGSAGRTLIDGNTSWDTAAAPAATAWNNVVLNLRYQTNSGAGSAVARGDGVNSIVFASTMFGKSFGSSTLAVTYYSYYSSGIIEADVLFNNRQAFDSYRGPLRYGNGGIAIGDIRRVLIHELGHALGLDHPDQHNQRVDAIMNSRTSDRETVSSDDISGAQFLYGAPTPLPTPTPSRFANISTRTNVGTGDNVLIGGFIVTGAQSTTVLLRAIGPSLASQGIANYLADPVLDLYNSSGALITSNNDWQNGTQAGQISSTGLAPKNALESALIATVAPGAYSAIVRGSNSTTGIALVEIYRLDSGNSRLANLSTRGPVGIDDDVLIGGIIITGTPAKNIILRAIGPSLAGPPVPLANALSDPVLELHNSSGALVATNDDWGDSAQAAAIASSGLKPTNAKESVIMTTLAPGAYSAIVRGANNGTGIALVEAYDLDP